MKRRTQRCAAHGHPEIELDVGEAPAELSDPLVAYLEDAVAAGTRFLAGQTIECGAALLKIEQAGEGLRLCEPVPGSMPIEWRPSVEQTVRSTAVQTYVAESFGLEVDLPGPFRHAYVCTRAGKAEETAFVRERTDDEGFSGWLAMCADADHDHDDPDELACVSVYELAIRLPYLAAFVGLPPESVVFVGAEGFRRAELEGAPLEVRPGTFLDAKLKAR